MHIVSFFLLVAFQLALALALSNTRGYDFHVAPMQGYTNAPVRHMFHLLSPQIAHLWTEMEKVRDLKEASPEALMKRFESSSTLQNINDHNFFPVTLQLGGNDPLAIEHCVKDLFRAGYSFPEINLNCGCPSIEAGGADFGASLMKDPIRTRQLIEAIGNGCSGHYYNGESCIVSLKCRIAAYETPEEMDAVYRDDRGSASSKSNLQGKQFHDLCSYISHARKGGISHLILHARPAVLSGLSPTKNRLIPPINYDIVQEIAREFPDLHITLNGGIKSMQHLEELTNEGGVDCKVRSYMAGRWILQKPLALLMIENQGIGASTEEGYPATLIIDALCKYMQYVEYHLQRKNSHTLAELCLPLYLVIEQLREIFDEDNGKEIEHVGLLEGLFLSEDELYTTLKDILLQLSSLIPVQRKTKALPDDVHWKHLSKYFKDFVGAKVYNKWKRNRSEPEP